MTAYTKYHDDWHDQTEAEDTPIIAEALEHIETGIATAQTDADTAQTTANTAQTTANTAQTAADAAQDTAEASIPKNTLTTKGDLILATGASTPTRLAVGTNDQVLTGASGQTTGVVWQKIGNAMIASDAAIAYSKLDLGNSIVNADIAAAASIALSKIDLPSWSTYTPTLTAATTNPTLGSGSSRIGRYIEIGDLVIASVVIKFGSSGTGAGNGAYEISLPVTARTPSEQTAIGSGFVTEAGVDNDLICPVVQASLTSKCQMVIEGGNVMSNSTPFVFGANDSIGLFLSYEAA